MKRLAVVGAGIGGCSAAYFASKYLPDTKVTIYDAQDKVGGRILTHKAAGVKLEVGATFLSGTNKTILGIVRSEQLKLKRIEDGRDFAIWNGSEFIFRSNKKASITNFKLLWRYKLSIVRALFLLREAKGQVAKLYQEQMKTPVETAELFESAGLSMWYTKPFDEVLLERGVSRTFIDEVAAPITRTIYSQNADLGGFAGISSLIGVYGGPIYCLAEGNSTLPAHLAEASRATVKLGHKVTIIEKTSEGSYRVSVGNDAALFDGVIVAAPLDVAGIELASIAKLNLEPQSYLKVYTKVMQGVFNPNYFGLNESTVPPARILTTKDADPITHFSIQKTQKEESIVTISSTEPVTDSAFSGVFKGGESSVLEHCWTAAYPKFKPIAKLPPSRLDKGLIYANSIEPSVSSMETAAVSALNVVKMMRNDLSLK
jgi:prenylcysteine oxidase / farnesylcysteine lyase